VMIVRLHTWDMSIRPAHREVGIFEAKEGIKLAKAHVGDYRHRWSKPNGMNHAKAWTNYTFDAERASNKGARVEVLLPVSPTCKDCDRIISLFQFDDPSSTPSSIEVGEDCGVCPYCSGNLVGKPVEVTK